MAPHIMSEGINFFVSISTLGGALCAQISGTVGFVARTQADEMKV